MKLTPILTLAAVAALSATFYVQNLRAVEEATTEEAAEKKYYTVAVNEANFEEVVLNADTPVLVDFWASWCGPCLAVAPTLDELAKEYDGKFVIAKVDVDKAKALSKKYKIRAIPNMKIFVEGEIVDEIVGAAAKEKIEGKMKAQLEG